MLLLMYSRSCLFLRQHRRHFCTVPHQGICRLFPPFHQVNTDPLPSNLSVELCVLFLPKFLLYKLHTHSECPPFLSPKARGGDGRMCFRHCNFLYTRPCKTKESQPFFHMLRWAIFHLHPTPHYLCILRW